MLGGTVAGGAVGEGVRLAVGCGVASAGVGAAWMLGVALATDAALARGTPGSEAPIVEATPRPPRTTTTDATIAATRSGPRRRRQASERDVGR